MRIKGREVFYEVKIEMKKIDWTKWKRAKHYQYFKGLDFPHFNVTAYVELTHFLSNIRKQNVPFFLSMVYVVTKVANEIPEFRYRICDQDVIEFETIHPSITYMTQEDVFDFLDLSFHDDFSTFLSQSMILKKNAEQGHKPEKKHREDLIYLTSLPWVSFTSIQHPVHLFPTDSIPRIAWGKYFEENGKIKMPLSVQAHHALMDGQHVGKYFIRVQELLNEWKSL